MPTKRRCEECGAFVNPWIGHVCQGRAYLTPPDDNTKESPLFCGVAHLSDAPPDDNTPAEVPGGRDFMDIVFDSWPVGHESARFIEVEDANGKSINAGDWIKRKDGYVVLRIQRSKTAPREAVEELIQAADNMALSVEQGWNHGLREKARELRAALARVQKEGRG